MWGKLARSELAAGASAERERQSLTFWEKYENHRLSSDPEAEFNLSKATELSQWVWSTARERRSQHADL